MKDAENFNKRIQNQNNTN